MEYVACRKSAKRVKLPSRLARTESPTAELNVNLQHPSHCLAAPSPCIYVKGIADEQDLCTPSCTLSSLLKRAPNSKASTGIAGRIKREQHKQPTNMRGPPTRASTSCTKKKLEWSITQHDGREGDLAVGGQRKLTRRDHRRGERTAYTPEYMTTYHDARRDKNHKAGHVSRLHSPSFAATAINHHHRVQTRAQTRKKMTETRRKMTELTEAPLPPLPAIIPLPSTSNMSAMI